jgi:hypothetical protein
VSRVDIAQRDWLCCAAGQCNECGAPVIQVLFVNPMGMRWFARFEDTFKVKDGHPVEPPIQPVQHIHPGYCATQLRHRDWQKVT